MSVHLSYFVESSRDPPISHRYLGTWCLDAPSSYNEKTRGFSETYSSLLSCLPRLLYESYRLNSRKGTFEGEQNITVFQLLEFCL